MSRSSWNKAGLAAVILLAPGGFVLGATLALGAYRRRKAARDAEEGESPSPEAPAR